MRTSHTSRSTRGESVVRVGFHAVAGWADIWASGDHEAENTPSTDAASASDGGSNTGVPFDRMTADT